VERAGKLPVSCKNGFNRPKKPDWHVIRSLLLAPGAIAPDLLNHLIKTK
jgi:hypothetical protein